MSAFDAYANAAQLLPTQSDPYAALAAYSQFSGPLVNFSPAYSAASIGEEIRTIFITGFPPDVKERELNNLLRFLHGYKASQMNWKNGQAQGFALFDSSVSARQSVESISQLVFDENHVLRCEMARKNMYVKEDGGDLMGRQEGGDYNLGMGGNVGLAAPTPVPTPAAVRPQGYGQITNMRDNSPCNTLFVGNLADTVDENELKQLFSPQPGFRQLKLVRSDKGTNCFVEFVDESCATVVHQQQQGAILTSSDRGPIRIQYSKNPFGQKRENGSIMDGFLPTPSPPYMSPSPRIPEAGMPSPHHHYQL
eukprot:TRINITY_DN3166_c1_g1_i1.p1 TRINITY_DN3166_c1_g1~~TRINITY_DN3166_c1_g1_i1.p1  ORF type:complete len:308 (+),score=64.93 TRINITY_DN3166_c1_g1_i1:189-1112(+)